MSIILSGLLCAGQCHDVTCCIVMFCCFPLLTVGDILLPVFFIVRICSPTGVVISRVLTVLATLSFFMGVNCFSHPVQIFSSVMGVNCLSHPIFYGANCSSHHVLSFFTGVNFFSHPVQNGAYCSSHHVFTCCVSISHPLLMVLTSRASVIFLPSGVINVWGTAILFILLQVQNNYKVLLINYSILKLHLQIFSEAVSSYFTLRLHPPILFWGLVFIIYFEALSSQVILKICPWIQLKASSASLLCNIIEAMFLSLRLWSSLWETHVALVCTAYVICLQDMYTCDSFPFVFVSRETDLLAPKF